MKTIKIYQDKKIIIKAVKDNSEQGYSILITDRKGIEVSNIPLKKHNNAITRFNELMRGNTWSTIQRVGNIEKGMYFNKLNKDGSLQKKLLIRCGYDNIDNKYEANNYYDINEFHYLDGNTLVYTDCYL